jgi:hypothetical protein
MTQQFQPGDRVVSTNASDDRVYTVEGAHVRYPDWYYITRRDVLALDETNAGIIYYADAQSIAPFLPLAIARCCPYCYKLKSSVRVRELCTNYGDDDDLFDGCLECFNDCNDYYRELIADYYAGCLS